MVVVAPLTEMVALPLATVPPKGAARSLVPAALAKTISAAEAEAIKTRRNRSADRALELLRFRIVRVLVIWLSVGLGLRL